MAQLLQHLPATRSTAEGCASGLATDNVAQRTAAQVDINYEAFQKILPTLLPERLNEYALMKDGAVVDFFATAMEAYGAGKERLGLGNFSMQKVIDRPVDFGFYSHVVF